MTAPRHLGLSLVLSLAGLAGVAALAQPQFASGEVAETRQAMAEARRQGEAVRMRAERLEGEARRAVEQVERTARQAAALAARIQQAEAEIATHEARIGIIARESEQLRASLAQRERPLIRLTAGLQRLSRRPPLLVVLRPGSLRDTMHSRALLETMMPQVRRQTAALRAELEKAHLLEIRAQRASGQLRASQGELRSRREQLLALETRQRLASRKASGVASRESERALALAEKARDLGLLVEEVGQQARLRDQLAQLPGPIMRPPRPEQSEVIQAEAFEPSQSGLAGYLLPLFGKLVTGFGAPTDGNSRSRGIVLAVRPGAQAVAPAPGRVAFAGPFRGYGRIVIIDHEGGWTTLVTGLAQLDASVGDMLVAGSPLGIAGPVDPLVSIELRRNGEPVNPMQFVGSP